MEAYLYRITNKKVCLYVFRIYFDDTDIMGLNQNPANGRRFVLIFLSTTNIDFHLMVCCLIQQREGASPWENQSRVREKDEEFSPNLLLFGVLHGILLKEIVHYAKLRMV